MTVQILGFRIHDLEQANYLPMWNPSREDTFMTIDHCKASRSGCRTERERNLEDGRKGLLGRLRFRFGERGYW